MPNDGNKLPERKPVMTPRSMEELYAIADTWVPQSRPAKKKSGRSGPKKPKQS